MSIRILEKMYEVLKTEKFANFFSFMIGISVVAILIPVCKGGECFVKKAPSVSEMKENTYRIGEKCYQFKPKTTECPASGVIEAFRGESFNSSGPKSPVWGLKDFAIVGVFIGAILLLDRVI